MSAVACVGVHERDPLEQLLESLFELHCGMVLREWRAQTFQGWEPSQPLVALVVPITSSGPRSAPCEATSSSR